MRLWNKGCKTVVVVVVVVAVVVTTATTTTTTTTFSCQNTNLDVQKYRCFLIVVVTTATTITTTTTVLQPLFHSRTRQSYLYNARLPLTVDAMNTDEPPTLANVGGPSADGQNPGRIIRTCQHC